MVDENDVELPAAAYLRDLAERLMYVPVMYGTDQSDYVRLNLIAASMTQPAINKINDGHVTAAEFIGYVRSRGYRADPILTDTTPARINGYMLLGPRGNRRAVCMRADGLMPLADARLWCDGVNYGSAAVGLARAGRHRS